MHILRNWLMLACLPRGNVAWTAVSIDPRSRRCGHASSMGLTDSQAVSVHADSDCSSGT
jgi:hypothetical protein